MLTTAQSDLSPKSGQNSPVVSVITLTYNQAPYIRECIEGILMQKTDFPIELIIHDDASTDGTTEIVKEYAVKYPNIIKPIIQTENQYSKTHSFTDIMENCFRKSEGNYIALCEGDDFWIDPLKLQKQVDFLETHSDYGLVHTNVYEVNWSSNFKKYLPVKKRKAEGDVYRDLLEENFIHTNTVLFRSEYIKYFKKEIYPLTYLDRILWTCISLHTKIHYIDEITGVYRILEQSATHGSYRQKFSFYKTCTDSLISFLKKNNRPQNEINTLCIPRYRVLLRYAYMDNNRRDVKIYWKLIKIIGHPSMKDYIFWFLSSSHMSPNLISGYSKLKLIIKEFFN